MYLLTTELETATGFLYCNMYKDVPISKEGLEVKEIDYFEKQMTAVHEMIRRRKDLVKHNLKVDPNYLPPRKRNKS